MNMDNKATEKQVLEGIVKLFEKANWSYGKSITFLSEIENALNQLSKEETVKTP
jgi:SpoU rRNA methylase family enzyme